jgi:predicted dehydrogenase
MKALVIGYGSIGSRHARLLQDLGCETAVVSSRKVDANTVYTTVSAALESERPDYVVIANKTNQHFETIAELIRLDFNGIVLVEKPIFHICLEIPQHRFKKIFVAYNLRFHPIIQKLHAVLNNKKILSAQVYVGQYLPDWRPQTDYRNNYSTRASEGGGVLRDLSHELDYINWLFGGWERMSALGGHYSSLEITSDDIFAIIMVARRCPVVTCHLNYLERETRRLININTDDASIEADLVNGTLQINGKIEKMEMDKDYTYRSMHKTVLSQDYSMLCSLEEGLEVMSMIQAAEQAVQQKTWVSR